jgi:L,D-transpeptidase YcbB
MGRRRSRGDVPVRAVIATVFLLSGCDGRDQRQPPPKALVGTRANTSLWVDASGQPNRNADAALSLLRQAGEQGLDPADYKVDRLAILMTSLRGPAPDAARHAAEFDAIVSRAILRYFRDLHVGRVDPRAIGFRMDAPADQHDFATMLRQAVETGRLAEVARELEPPLPQYRALRAALARYRALAARPEESLPAPRTLVRPGDSYAGVDALERRLASLGDLPTDLPASSATRYEGPIVEGTKRFQKRHGINADGVLGPRTQAALQIPIGWRVRQIELALERSRWLPHLGKAPLIVLNIPMFRLWAWDSSSPDSAPSLRMDVIVGRALRTETPVFVEEMNEVIFRPFWNIPSSIVRREILPAIQRDPNYLRSQDMEIVRGVGDEAPVVEATAENIARLRQGSLRLRQRPGPRNALGLIKFVFPNDENVYMHGTPATALFALSRRDFSHGCVRVADPVALAEWVMKDSATWDRDRILTAMAGSRSIHVKLPRPLRLILFYTTAAVMPEDDTVRFADDIYRQDARLDEALAKTTAARLKEEPP